MLARRRGVLMGLLCAAACSGHPLGGSWEQRVAAGEGLTLEFDGASNRLQVHGVPRADGGHEHYAGTYALSGQALSVEWTQDGRQARLQGTVAGDQIRLAGTDGALEFHRGEHAHDR